MYHSGTETPEEKSLRIRNALREIEQSRNETFFDLYLVNEDIDVASKLLFRKVRDW